MLGEEDEKRFIEFKRCLRRQKVDVHLRDDRGCNALMCAAIGRNSKPNTQVFEYLLKQNEQPLSVQEKIEGLELLGSTHILNNSFKAGLECWKCACGLRSGGRRDDPPANEIPTMVLNTLQPEFTVYSQLARIKEDQLNLVHQALLVRHRLCGVECYGEITLRLRKYIRTRISSRKEQDCRYNDFIQSPFDRQYVLLLLEWDEFYASSSVTRDHCYDPATLTRFFCAGVTHFTRPSKTERGATPAVLVTLLKWFTAYAERKAGLSARDRERKRTEMGRKIFKFLRELLTHLGGDCWPLDVVWTGELKSCLKRLVAVDLCSSEERGNLLHELCSCFRTNASWRHLKEDACTVYSDDEGALKMERVLRLLIEAGIDVNDVNQENLTCCFYLMLTLRTSHVGMLQLLLDGGDRWDIQGLNRELIDEWKYKMFIQRYGSLMRHSVLIKPTISLQSMCLRTMRLNYETLRKDIDSKLPERLKKNFSSPKQRLLIYYKTAPNDDVVLF